MAITGAGDDVTMVGGEYSQGGASPGVYRIRVAESSTKDGTDKENNPTKTLLLELHGSGDADHPAKEGKKVIVLRQKLPSKGMDAEEVKKAQGMLKRLCYDGFGIAWPKEAKAFDPRVFQGKEAFVLIENTPDRADPTKTWSNVSDVQKEREKLRIPAAIIAASNGVAKGATTGRARR